MPDTQVVLGGVVFQGFEVPERINFGGQQRLVVHKLIGGNRTVDALGSDQDDLQWEGRFRGNQALQRAQAIDRMRQLGQPVTLSWGGITYQVIIATATFQYERFYEIPYRIVCTPANPETPPPLPAQSASTSILNSLGSVGGAISGAQASVVSFFSDMAPDLADAASYVSGASQTVGALGGLAGLPTSALSPVVTALNSSQSALQGAIQIGDGNIFTGAQQIAGVIPGSPTGGASLLTGQIAALHTLSNLVVARGQVGVAINNIQNVNAASPTAQASSIPLNSTAPAATNTYSPG